MSSAGSILAGGVWLAALHVAHIYHANFGCLVPCMGSSAWPDGCKKGPLSQAEGNAGIERSSCTGSFLWFSSPPFGLFGPSTAVPLSMPPPPCPRQAPPPSFAHVQASLPASSSAATGLVRPRPSAARRILPPRAVTSEDPPSGHLESSSPRSRRHDPRSFLISATF